MPGSARLIRSWLAGSALLGVLAAPSPAWGWVEKTFESDRVTLDVERDGSAVVAHEILVWIRGGPLPEIALEPVDADAEPLPEATATLAKSGAAAGWPIPLSVVREESRLRLHVLEGKGLRSGKYQIRFRYRTSLASSGKLHPGTSSTGVEWSGIGFPDGIDSATVVFRLPRGTAPPRLQTSEAGQDGQDGLGGVFLGTARRSADKDELEVVRPHVAKGEVVAWRVQADRAVFDLAVPDQATPTPAASPPPALHASPRRAASDALPLALGGLGALLYGAAIVLKARSVELACALRRAHPRPLVPLALPLRAAIGALGLAGAVAIVLRVPFPSLAAASLLVTIACAAHLPPRVTASLRGPGKWIPLSGEAGDAAFDDDEPPLPGRLADAGSPLGFVLFTALLMGFVAGAIIVMRRSPYQGIALALGSSVLFPLFFTGRSGELPLSPVRAPRELLEWLVEALGRDSSLVTQPIGRVPLGGTEHDELRLLVTPARSVQGLVAIEVGVDCHSGPLGAFVLPFVLVRVVEGMPAADVLPKGLLWTRGRTADERVAVLRPKVPTRRLVLELTREVARRLTVVKEPRRQVRTSAARSSGSGSVTAKAGTPSSPLHAT